MVAFISSSSFSRATAIEVTAVVPSIGSSHLDHQGHRASMESEEGRPAAQNSSYTAGS